MADEKYIIPEDSVIRLLEQQSRHGIDQETMLIYMNSINLMNILNLMGKKFGGSLSLSVPAPALPPLAPGQSPAGGPALESMIGLLLNMLGNQGGGGSSGGQGINPAMLMSLLSALGGQNLDLPGLMSKFAAMMGTPQKPGAGPVTGNTPQTAPAPGGALATNTQQARPPVQASAPVPGQSEHKPPLIEPVKREAPKVMKWDSLDDRKKA